MKKTRRTFIYKHLVAIRGQHAHYNAKKPLQTTTHSIISHHARHPLPSTPEKRQAMQED